MANILCSKGHFHVLEWWLDNFSFKLKLVSDKVQIVPEWGIIFIPKVILRSGLERCNKPPSIEFLQRLPLTNTKLVKEVFTVACRKGFLSLAQWLYVTYLNSEDEIALKCLRIPSVICHSDIIKWLCSHFCDDDLIGMIHADVFTLVCENGSLELLQWFHLKYFANEQCSWGILEHLSMQGEMEKIQWLLDHFQMEEYIVDPPNNFAISPISCIECACYSGHLSVAQLLFKMLHNDIIRHGMENHKWKYDLLYNLLYHNSSTPLECLQWVYHAFHYTNDQVQELQDMDHIVCYLCVHGNLPVLQWLYSLEVKILTYCEDMLVALLYGDINVAVWLKETFGITLTKEQKAQLLHKIERNDHPLFQLTKPDACALLKSGNDFYGMKNDHVLCLVKSWCSKN